MTATETALTEQVATTLELEATAPEQQAASAGDATPPAESAPPQPEAATAPEPEKPKTTAELIREAASDALGLDRKTDAVAATDRAKPPVEQAPPQAAPLADADRELVKKYVGSDDPESVAKAASEYVQFKARLEQDGLTMEDLQFGQNVAAARKSLGLSDEAMTYGIEIARIVQYDSPRDIVKKLTPFIEEMRKQAGEVLPDDLRQQVESGALSEDAAREIARVKAEAAWHAMERERIEREAQQREIARGRTELVSAAETWAAAKAKTVPGFADNKGGIADNTQAMFLGMYHALPNDKKPRTAAEITALLDKALDRVRSVAPPIPSPPPKVPAQPGRIVTTASPPKSLGGVIAQHLGLNL